MAHPLRRFSKRYIQDKTNLFQQIQNVSTILCVPMNVINPLFNKTFKRFTELLYGIVDMTANVAVNVQKLRRFTSKQFFKPSPFPPRLIGAIRSETRFWNGISSLIKQLQIRSNRDFALTSIKLMDL